MGSGDAFGGLMSALGIMVALHQRRRTGKGQYVDASLYGAQLFLGAPSLQAYLATGSKRYSEQQSRMAAPNPLWNRYQARDRWVFLCVENEDPAFATLCESLECADLVTDARFARAQARAENASALVALLDEIVSERDAGDWMQRWRPLGIAASPIQTFEDLQRDPQAWQNDYFVTTRCEAVDSEVPVRGLPITLSKTPGRVEKLGPELGEDTEIILASDLGYSWEEIEEFKQKGAIP
jgi:crotonobetainyl-CoA:carnitine CoA-transferase CaiB-like acyl-CoA transferase